MDTRTWTNPKMKNELSTLHGNLIECTFHCPIGLQAKVLFCNDDLYHQAHALVCIHHLTVIVSTTYKFSPFANHFGANWQFKIGPHLIKIIIKSGWILKSINFFILSIKVRLREQSKWSGQVCYLEEQSSALEVLWYSTMRPFPTGADEFDLQAFNRLNEMYNWPPLTLIL